MTRLAYTHRCPGDMGGLMTSARACQKRLRLLGSPQEFDRQPTNIKLSLQNCQGCAGPEELAEPITVESLAAPGAVATCEEERMNEDLCKCGKPRGLDKNGDPKPMCDDCLRNHGRRMQTPEARAKAAETRRRRQEAREAALREQAKAEVRAEMHRDLVGKAREARDELVDVLAAANAAPEDIAGLANNLIMALDTCGAVGAIQGWQDA
jgi:hypothetical protein